jgi:opacity protein-like surface antigen
LRLQQLQTRYSCFVIITAFAVGLLGVPSAIGQTVSQKPSQKTFTGGVDVSLGVFGQLTDTRTAITLDQIQIATSTTQRTQGTSPSAGVLGTLHQSFRPWLGYNVNLGYTRFSENYSYGSALVPSNNSTVVRPVSSFSQGTIGTNMYELTIAYVVEGPRNKRFSTFGQFGGGGLFFLPTQSNSPASQQTRPTMVFGVGMNYKLTNHLDVRAEYRGLFYKGPDFAYSLSTFPITKLFTVTNTPAVSLVYRFGGAKRSTNATKFY